MLNNLVPYLSSITMHLILEEVSIILLIFLFHNSSLTHVFKFLNFVLQRYNKTCNDLLQSQISFNYESNYQWEPFYCCAKAVRFYKSLKIKTFLKHDIFKCDNQLNKCE